MSEQIVIVGGVAAGTKAAAVARRYNPDLDIILIQEENEVSYSGCGLPYHLAQPNLIKRNSLVARTSQSFRQSGIDLRCEQQVLELNTTTQRVKVLNLKTKVEEDIAFDKLLLATGASPLIPNFSTTNGAPKLISLRSINDADKIIRLLPNSKKIVIIGGGYIGLEMAETFHRLKRNVCIVEMSPTLLPDYPKELSDLVVNALNIDNLSLRLGIGVQGLEKGGVVLGDGSSIEADLVLVAIGVRPRIELAVDAGISIGVTGAIQTNAKMETSVPNVYAAGDCAESMHRVSKEPVWIPLGDTANRQGRVAGINMAGGDTKFPGITGSAIFSTFGLGVGRVGLTEQEAKKVGYEAVSQIINHQSRAKYMPESQTQSLSLVAEKGTGRVLGAQAVGADGIDKTIATLSVGIWGELSVDDLADVDLPYAPPFSPIFSPVQIGAEVLRKKISLN